MNAATRRLLIALLLPVLALQVLLPAGFMPVAEGGELRMVMCAEGLQLPGSDGGEAPAPDESGKCPFALATASVLPPQSMAHGLAPALSSQPHALANEDLPPAAGPQRSNTARAPPAFS